MLQSKLQKMNEKSVKIQNNWHIYVNGSEYTHL